MLNGCGMNSSKSDPVDNPQTSFTDSADAKWAQADNPIGPSNDDVIIIFIFSVEAKSTIFLHVLNPPLIVGFMINMSAAWASIILVAE